jgi:hypothetical protein
VNIFIPFFAGNFLPQTPLRVFITQCAQEQSQCQAAGEVFEFEKGPGNPE